MLEINVSCTTCITINSLDCDCFVFVILFFLVKKKSLQLLISFNSDMFHAIAGVKMTDKSTGEKWHLII